MKNNEQPTAQLEEALSSLAAKTKRRKELAAAETAGLNESIAITQALTDARDYVTEGNEPAAEFAAKWAQLWISAGTALRSKLGMTPEDVVSLRDPYHLRVPHELLRMALRETPPRDFAMQLLEGGLMCSKAGHPFALQNVWEFALEWVRERTCGATSQALLRDAPSGTGDADADDDAPAIGVAHHPEELKVEKLGDSPRARVRIIRVKSSATIDAVEIGGSSLVRFVMLVHELSRARAQYDLVSWDEVERAWFEQSDWKRPLDQKTLKDYGRRIRRALEAKNLSNFWKQTPDLGVRFPWPG